MVEHVLPIYATNPPLRSTSPNETHAYYGTYSYLLILVCVEDQRSEKPNHLHKVIS